MLSAPECASVADVRRAVAAHMAAEAAREQRADELFAAAAARVQRGSLPRDAVQRAVDRATALRTRFHATAEIAAQLHGEMDQLHEERLRVELAAEWCAQVTQLKTSLAALNDALERREWDACVSHCVAAMRVDPAVLHSEFAQRMVPSAMLPDSAPQTLSALRTALLDKCTSLFHQYTRIDPNEAEATRFLAYFPQLDAHDAGLQAYTAFATSLVGAQGAEIAAQLAEPPTNPLCYAVLWNALFEYLAVFLNKHQPVVDRLYAGHTAFATGVLPGLCTEWTRIGQAILDRWSTARAVTQMVQMRDTRFAALESVRAAPYAPGRIYEMDRHAATASASAAHEEDNSASSTLPTDTLLTELAALASQWSLFRQYLRNAMHVDMDSLEHAAHLAPSNALSTQFRALGAHVFAPLQLWLLRAGIQQVHKLDTPDLSARPYASSLPDDMFFTLRAALTRTILTGALDFLDYVLGQALALVENDFVEVVVLRMDGCRRALNVARLVDGPRRIAAAREVRATMAVYLNVLDTSAVYAERLAADLSLETFLEQYFDAAELGAAQQRLACLGSLAPKLRSALCMELEELYSTLVEPRVGVLVDAVRDVGYDMGEAAYARAKEDDTLAKRVAHGWESVMQGFREQLTEGNYALLFARAVDAVVQPWEAAVTQMRFTELGALRFDQDLRTVLRVLSAHTERGIREKLARLQQMAFVLNLDEDDLENCDAYEAGAAIGLQWQLTRSEVLATRALRT